MTDIKVTTVRVPFKKCLDCVIFNREAENEYDCYRHPDCPSNREPVLELKIGVDPKIVVKRLSEGLLGGLLEEDEETVMDALKKSKKHKLLMEVLKTFALLYYRDVIKPYEAYEEKEQEQEEESKPETQTQQEESSYPTTSPNDTTSQLSQDNDNAG